MENNVVLISSLLLAFTVSLFTAIIVAMRQKMKKLQLTLLQEKSTARILDSLMLNNFDSTVRLLKYVNPNRLAGLAVHITNYVNNGLKQEKKIPFYLLPLSSDNPELWTLTKEELTKTMNIGFAVFLASQSIVFRHIFAGKSKRMSFIEDLALDILFYNINKKSEKASAFKFIKNMFQSEFDKDEVFRAINKFNEGQKKSLQKSIDNFISNLEPVELQN